jgi:dipeptidyl aminopeptidase/acylaminoacyl peptidase
VTAFTDLSAFAAIPRLTALRLSPDGTWLAGTVQTVTGTPPAYRTSIWRIPVGPGGTPARLTRGEPGEAAPEFLPDGSLLFTARRPVPPPPGEETAPEPDGPGLWLLPAAGGEARLIAAPPGGVAGVSAARAAGAGTAFACTADVFPGAATAKEDADRRKARADAGVHAILHDSHLVRYWDHDLGPDSLRLLAGDALRAAGERQAASAATAPEPAEPRDLTPDAGRALDEQSFELSPDGAAVITGWVVPDPAGSWHAEIVLIDTASGARTTLAGAPDADFEGPRLSPDGNWFTAVRAEQDNYDRPGDVTLVVGPVSGDPAELRDLLPGFDRRPTETAWAADGRSVFFTADDHGRHPVFRVGLDGGEVTRLTGDGAYTSLCPSPDGRYLYALRNAVDAPPAPVRLDLAAAGSQPEPLASPAPALTMPGTLTEVTAQAADGTPLRAWLVLPADATGPVPLVLWVHGGPLSSWNTWSWRWNPWLMAARGYAVLLPDPALSTGYGQHMIERGHTDWGAAPYTDVMTITDAVVARPDIDASRTAMMGGSFGGYMANWIAGHTDRFRAIVSHAGLWSMDQMLATTDWPAFWRRIFGDPLTQPERYLASSPHRHVASISTPMLVIHGDKDYRVPVGEALRLWADLQAHGKTARFLYFPDENHWILKPGDVPVWYETVFAFLAEHVRGEPWQRPELL